MAFVWGINLEKKLETFMYSMRHMERGIELRDFAEAIDIQLESKEDKAKLRYRIRTIKNKNSDLADIGYTSDGYIFPVDQDDYYKLHLRYKNLGLGHLRKAENLKAKGKSLPRKKSATNQLEWDFA